MTREEAKTALGDRNNLLWGMSKEEQKYYSEALDMAISTLSVEPCEDCISRAEAISHPFANGKYDHEHANEDYILGFESYKEWLEYLPSVQLTPEKGEWIRHTRVEPVYDIAGVKTWGIKHQCNRCTFTTTAVEDFGYYHFCPNCGADMRGE